MIKTINARSAPSTVMAHRPVVSSVVPLIEQLAEEMIARWRNGESPLAEELLARSPELAEKPEAVLELVAEELALRTEFKQPTNLQELQARFPSWPAQLAALVECQQALGTEKFTPRFPEAGDWLGEFQLLAELGRGAQGQVYLARQPSLANRQVVLKLGPTGSSEHLCLARLQHTHIVPLYSAHDFPELGLTGFCMPHFGGATLATIIESLGQPSERSRTGRHIVDVLRRVENDLESKLTPSPALAFLDHASATETVCWIGASLADALQYAHEHGLLHLDLKPSNVLVASDGTPMLLDFHLARPPLRAGEAAPTRLGGTIGYMPPEQHAALKLVASGGPIPEAVDARADVHALGVMLEELTRTLQGDQATVSPGMFDILARCTAKRVSERYATAGDVATDLRRHLADLPLRGVPNRSLTERWAKWRRRRPFAMPLALTLLALALICFGLFIRGATQVRRAETAMRAGEAHLVEHRYREATVAFQHGESLVDGVPGQARFRDRLRSLRHEAELGLASSELHALCERIRPLYTSSNVTADQANTIAGQCRAIWNQRDIIARQLANKNDSNWQRDLLDLGILTAHFEALATPNAGEDVHKNAIAMLEEVEAMLGPSRVLTLELAKHRRALKLPENPQSAADPQSAWDLLVLGRHELAAGRLDDADRYFERSLALEPQSLWANYSRGLCSLRLDRTLDAVASFSVCVALAPNSPWCVYNRGIALQKAGKAESALADFTRALTLDPKFESASLGRSELHLQAGRISSALADLEQARVNGSPVAEIHFRKARVFLANKDRVQAVQNLRDCLARDPTHVAAKELLASLGE